MSDKQKDAPQSSRADSNKPSPELQARVEALPHIPKEPDSTVPDPSSKAGSEQQVLLTERIQYAQGVHQYVNEYIRFADGKAGFLFAFVTAAISFLYSKSLFQSWSHVSVCSWKLLDFTAFIGSSALVISGFAAFWVVKPRLRPQKDDGLIFWETVASRRDANSYVGEVASLTGSGMVSEIIDHTYHLSRVARFKYHWLKISILASGFSVVVWIIYFFLAGRQA